MCKSFIVFFFLLVAINASSKAIDDSIVFIVKDDIVTKSDLKAYTYILGDESKGDGNLLKQIIDIEKKYYCLTSSFPFKSEFKLSFNSFFYKLNLFYGNRFIKADELEKRGIDFGILKQNLFKFMFVVKFSNILEDNYGECSQIPVYFPDS